MAKSGLFELNAVVAVSAHRNFRRAAAELGMSPSALSHAIATLEQRVGVRLFNRTTRSVSLSEAGEHFLARVQPALREIGAAMKAITDFRDTPTGTLRINTSEGAARMVLDPIVFEFMRRYPDMKVDIATEGKFVDIVAEGFDAGIRIAEHIPQDMIAVPCSAPVRFVVVGAPEYFASHKKPRVPGDLIAHNCVRGRYPSGGLYKWVFAKRGVEQVIDVSGSLTLDNHNLMVDAALRGVGLVWTNAWAVADHLAAGRLFTVLDDWCPEEPGLCLYYPGRRHVPAGLRAFIEVVKEVMPTLAKVRLRPNKSH